MKLLSVFGIYLMTFGVIIAEADLEVFKEIGSYKINETASGESLVKFYYLSENYEASWTDSYYYCLANNMHLASFDSTDELKKFIKSSKPFRAEFNEHTNVDGTKLVNDIWKLMSNGEDMLQEVYRFDFKYNYGVDYKCLIMTKKKRPSFSFSPYYCSTQKSKFLCQDIRAVKNYTNAYSMISHHVHVPSAFFKNIGSFNSSSNGNFKTYHMSRNYQLTPMKAALICRKNFNMKLVDLESKDEFENLIRLIAQNSNKIGETIIVGGFIEQMKKKSWYSLVGGSSGYNSGYNSGYDTEGKCLAIVIDRNSQSGIFRKINCNEGKRDFICQSETSDLELITSNKRNKSPVTIGMELVERAEFPQENGSIILKSYYMPIFAGATWIDGFSYCKTLGMNFFSPVNELEEAYVINSLNAMYGTSNIIQSIFVGGTRVGSEIFWYWINSGLQIDYELPWLDDQLDVYYCLKLEKLGRIFRYKDTDCDTRVGKFLCEFSEERQQQETTTDQFNIDNTTIVTVDILNTFADTDKAIEEEEEVY